MTEDSEIVAALRKWSGKGQLEELRLALSWTLCWSSDPGSWVLADLDGAPIAWVIKHGKDVVEWHVTRIPRRGRCVYAGEVKTVRLAKEAVSACLEEQAKKNGAVLILSTNKTQTRR